jgi:hypothetical protein
VSDARGRETTGSGERPTRPDGTPEAVSATLYLVSEASAQIMGVTLDVTGGKSIP